MDDLDQRTNGHASEAAPVPQLFQQSPVSSAPPQKRGVLIAATAAASAFALALGGVTAMWLGARGDISDAKAQIETKDGQIAQMTTEGEDAEERISSLEGEVNGLHVSVAATSAMIA